jgi:cobyrinic acid a,c-diamide synthase
LADAAEQYIDIEKLLARAEEATPLESPVTTASGHNGSAELWLGVAQDEAFQFYYADLFPALEKRGCKPVFFSPLHDEQLPENLDGLYFGGGYPEVYAQQLSDNLRMRTAVAEFCASGRPVYAECGGLIYLSRGLESAKGTIPLLGIVPVTVRMLEKRKALGYVTATLGTDSLFGHAGDQFRGHEFHYSELSAEPTESSGWQAIYRLEQNRSGKIVAEGYQRGNILASYAHLHLASNSRALDHFIKRLRCGVCR